MKNERTGFGLAILSRFSDCLMGSAAGMCYITASPSTASHPDLRKSRALTFEPHAGCGIVLDDPLK